MRLPICVAAASCFFTLAVRADGPSDNLPEKVRRIPPPGIKVPDADRVELESGAAELGKEIEALRAELKAKKDYTGLSQLPRDASPTRVVNRCEVTGRRRAFIRRFKISRLTFRELASQGLIPGVTKSSW